MILSPEDMKAYVNNFTNTIFAKAWDDFNFWVRDEISSELEKLGLSIWFFREGRVWPFTSIAVDLVRDTNLHPSLCNKFDAEYDLMRQMMDIEGNYYEHMLRNAVCWARDWEELLEFIPRGAHFGLWQISFTGVSPQFVKEDKVEEFKQINQIALDYLNKRLTFYSLGINKRFIS